MPLKTIGLIGGMSWISTIEYYKIINEEIGKRLDKLHSAKIFMLSADFEEIKQLLNQGRWDLLRNIMIDAAQRIERVGADFVLICTNTMHLIAEEVEANINIPLLHIINVTAKEIKSRHLKKVGLLGTKFVMDFYKKRLLEEHKIETIIPDQSDRETVHRIIYDELVLGEIEESSRKKCRAIISELANNGAEAVILGCTEIPLLIQQAHSIIPIFDTTRIHALAAVDLALSDSG